MPQQRLKKRESTTLENSVALLNEIAELFNDKEAEAAAESVAKIAEKYADEKPVASSAK